MDLNKLYTAKKGSLMIGKEESYIRTLYNKFPEKLKKGEYRKIGKELIVTDKLLEYLKK